MRFGILYEQGEIVVVPFPFSNLKNTTYSVLIDDKNLEKEVIPKQSRVKVNKIFTLDKAIIRKKIAKLNKNCFDKVKEEYFKMI